MYVYAICFSHEHHKIKKSKMKEKEAKAKWWKVKHGENKAIASSARPLQAPCMQIRLCTNF